MRIFNPNDKVCVKCGTKGKFSAVAQKSSPFQIEDIICNNCKHPMDRNIWKPENSLKERLSSFGIKEVNDVLDKMSEEEVKKVVTDKYECKLCKQWITPKEILEHAVTKHNDKDAACLLDRLNRFRGT